MAVRKIVQDKNINKFKLDEELELQPSVFRYWARQAADAKEERDLAKNALKKLEGKTEVDIWTGKYKLPTDKDGKKCKLTGDTVKALINADDDINVARIELAQQEKLYSKAAANEETMQQKRSSLKHLVELYIKEYFSHMDSAGGSTKVEQSSATVKKKLNKK